MDDKKQFIKFILVVCILIYRKFPRNLLKESTDAQRKNIPRSVIEFLKQFL